MCIASTRSIEYSRTCYVSRLPLGPLQLTVHDCTVATDPPGRLPAPTLSRLAGSRSAEGPGAASGRRRPSRDCAYLADGADACRRRGPGRECLCIDGTGVSRVEGRSARSVWCGMRSPYPVPPPLSPSHPKHRSGMGLPGPARDATRASKVNRRNLEMMLMVIVSVNEMTTV